MITLKTKSSDKPQPPRKKGSSSNLNIVKIFVSPRKCECFMVVDSYNRQHHNYLPKLLNKWRKAPWMSAHAPFYLFDLYCLRAVCLCIEANQFNIWQYISFKIITKQLFAVFFKLILFSVALTVSSSIDKPFPATIVLESTCITNSHRAHRKMKS